MLPVMESEKLVEKILESMTGFTQTNGVSPTSLRLGEAEHKSIVRYSEVMISNYDADGAIKRFANMNVTIHPRLYGFEIL